MVNHNSIKQKLFVVVELTEFTLQLYKKRRNNFPRGKCIMKQNTRFH